MRSLDLEYRILSAWAFLCGIALWLPALGIPVWRIYLQPLDFLILAGLPLLPVFWRQFTGSAFWVFAPLLASIALSWIAMGGSPVILAWTLCLAIPFIALAFVAMRCVASRHRLVQGFLVGAAVSTGLFLCQVTFGAEALDFRSNSAFNLPPQYGRGFALFPEVSTFAAHAVIAFGVALAGALHRDTDPGGRAWRLLLMLVLATAFLFSRSTSIVVLAPLLIGAALAVSTRPNLNTLLLTMLIATLSALFLSFFLSAFYIDRLASNAAERSASMRLASVLGGLSPLLSGEIFGLGLGENEAVRLRAHQVARSLGLNFGNLPTGVNSQIIGRIFEEGWPALLNIGLAVVLLVQSRRIAGYSGCSAAIFVLGVGSLLTALLVTGYRGIYTNWIWLAAAAALSADFAAARKGAAVKKNRQSKLRCAAT